MDDADEHKRADAEDRNVMEHNVLRRGAATPGSALHRAHDRKLTTEEHTNTTKGNGRNDKRTRQEENPHDERHVMLVLHVGSRQERDAQIIRVEKDRMQLNQNRLTFENECLQAMLDRFERRMEIEQHRLELDTAEQRGAAESGQRWWMSCQILLQKLA